MSRIDYFSFVPQELISEILVSLPAKSLGRCKCVSKLWNFLISDPHFIKTHLTETSKTKLILFHNNYETCFLYSLDFDNDNWFVRRLKFNLSNVWSMVWGSCNGLILVSDNYQRRLFLLNPTTLESKRLPLPHLSCEDEEASFVFGFGYDVSRDDYIIVAISNYYSGKKGACVYVYALETNWQWRMIGVSPYNYYFRRRRFSHYDKRPSAGIFMGGCLHWLAKNVNDSSWVISAFNIANEEFSDVPLPNELFGLNLFDPRLGVFKSRLCLINTTELWVMKEYGVVTSWIKLLDDLYETYNVGQFTHDMSLKMLEDSIVLLGSNDSFLLVSEARESRWFKYMNFTGSENSFQVTMTFVDSLVSLNNKENKKQRGRTLKKRRGRHSKMKRGRISKSIEILK